MKRILFVVATALSLAVISAGQQATTPESSGNASTRHASKHHRHHHHSGHHGKHHNSTPAPKS